ncbi:MAG: hypothetical protein IPJ82_09405 [Lewinellaceae bacterium]|nr:hypothetical protein [Lewinellaceae bacterium]
MKKLFLGLLLLPLALLWPACEKNSLPPTSFDDPVFFVNFKVDTFASQTLTAGVNDVYLFTRLETGPDDVITSYNYFSNTQCPEADCPGSLGFEFRSHFGVDSVFSGGYYPYKKPDSVATPDYYDFEYEIRHFDQYSSWTLSVNNTLLLESANIFKISVPAYNLDARSVLVSATKNNGPTSTYSRTLLPDNPSAYPSVEIKAVFSQGQYMLTAETSGAPVIEYLWSNGLTDSIIHSDTLLKTYSVTVTDGAGNTAEAGLDNLSGVNSISTAGVSFSYQPVYNPLQLGTVVIQWVDESGTIWRSDLGEQPNDTFFQILSSEPYEANENGVATQKLTVAYQCVMYNIPLGSLQFSGSGVIAMAVPGP